MFRVLFLWLKIFPKSEDPVQIKLLSLSTYTLYYTSLLFKMAREHLSWQSTHKSMITVRTVVSTVALKEKRNANYLYVPFTCNVYLPKVCYSYSDAMVT